MKRKRKLTGKKWYNSLSVDELETLSSTNRLGIQKNEEARSAAQGVISTVLALEAERNFLYDKIRSIRKQKIDGFVNFINALFDGNEKEMAKSETDELVAKVRVIDDKIHQLGGSSHRLEEIIRRSSSEIIRLQEFINNNDRRIATLKRKGERSKKRKDKYEHIQALAAAHEGKTRSRASIVKKSLGKSNECPYCFQFVDEELVADHIVPVSYGGLSVEVNMVYVCSSCNSKKSNLTLREFCLKFSLDRKRIELNLEELGKKF